MRDRILHHREYLAHIFGYKVHILKHKQNAQIDEYCQRQKSFLRGTLCVQLFNSECGKVIKHDREHHRQNKSRLTPRIEKQARQ